jgi:hypothetical protein
MSDTKDIPDSTQIDLVPALRTLVEAEKLQIPRLSVGLEKNDKRDAHISDKHVIFVTDGEKVAPWPVGSLTELFRGDNVPPANMEQYPPEYVMYLFFLERHLMMLNEIIGDRTDQEMEEVYSALRRRPDGRSVGPTHDFMWQVSALLLGCYVLSAAELEGIFGALLRSARSWGIRPVSRNYAGYLRDTFGST